jgi:L-fuculose-phosphate aldolase
VAQSNGDLLADERSAVAAAARRLAALGLVERTSGNLSARAGELIAVSPTGGVLAELEASEIAVVDLRGEQVAGPLAPTSEIALHLGAYERYGTGAVVHTHAPTATALGCVLDELPCVHYEMLALGGAIRVAPYETFGTSELAAGALDALEGKAAVLLANHGTITIGSDLAGAVAATELLEWSANVYWRAAQIGEPRTLGQAELDAVVAAVSARGYGTKASS